MTLHPQLAQDCSVIGHFPLCQLLLMEDANYPWFILVPARADITEIHQLSVADQQQLMHESVVLSQALEQAFSPDKLNIAALGNVVPQLHVHHILPVAHDVMHMQLRDDIAQSGNIQLVGTEGLLQCL